MDHVSTSELLVVDNMLSKHMFAILTSLQHFQLLERARSVSGINGLHEVDIAVDGGYVLDPEDQVREVVFGDGLDGLEDRDLVDHIVPAELWLMLSEEEAGRDAVRRSCNAIRQLQVLVAKLGPDLPRIACPSVELISKSVPGQSCTLSTFDAPAVAGRFARLC
jgi:hypothetical protein